MNELGGDIDGIDHNLMAIINKPNGFLLKQHSFSGSS